MRTKNINSVLSSMRESGRLKDMKGKGDAGEQAVLQIALDRLKHTGGFVYWSFRYPYQANREGRTYLGNIKLEDGKYVEYTDTKNGRRLEDEIDILYVSPYRIFPIEVKAYHAAITVDDTWVKKQGTPVDKSPVAQAEKHARHLYHALYDVIPDGNPKYIKPLVCFVDRCKLIDNRAEENIEYLPCCVLNNLKSIIIKLNEPLDYNLDMEMVHNKLEEVKAGGREYHL